MILSYNHLRCLLLLLLFLATNVGFAAPEPITSLRQLRDLTPAEAAQGIPVDVTGVITYSEIPRNINFIQNEDGAAYVNIYQENGKVIGRPNLTLKAGDRVRLRGVTAPGGFVPCIWPPEGGNIKVSVLGEAPLPGPMRLFPTVIVDPPLDNFRVEVTGVVTTIGEVDGRTVITINDSFDDYDLLIKGPPIAEEDLPPELIDSRVRAAGVFGAITNDQRELVHARFFIPSIDDIEIIEKGAESVFEKEPVSYADLTGYQVVTGERLHVRGTVTATRPPSRLYLELEDGPLEIRTNSETLPAVGTQLQVAGYRGLENSKPYLHTVALREIPQGTQTPPTPLLAGFTLGNLRHGQLISVEGRVVDTLVSEERSLVLIENGISRFTAEIPRVPGVAEDRPQNGTVLRVSGVLLQPSGEGEGSGFHLLLRDEADITILKRPPFWTRPRIVFSIVAFALASVGFAVWSFWLKHKVRTQARLLADKFEAEKLQAERTRISRDLHDTLEQDLAAVNMQLNLAGDEFSTRPETASVSLANARRILQRTRMESRHSIQELREEDFGDPHMGKLLERLIQHFQMDSGVVIDNAPPPDFDVPAGQRRELQLILREALHNAVQHGDASTIRLSGERRGDDCVLEVQDDGCGFDPESPPPGRFGLKGMEERARQLKASLEIASTIGKGTRIRLTLHGIYRAIRL